ncbi:MAG: transporter substrate-binding domain-containing protein [Leeuwenhoekiella sp.]
MIRMFFAAIVLNLITLQTSFAQNDSTEIDVPKNLIVGVHERPPFMIKGQHGNWDGISIRLWRRVAEELNVTYQLTEVKEDQPIDSTAPTELLLLTDLTQENHAAMDYSHIYYISEMGAATMAGMKIKSVLKAFFSKRFWYIAGSLSVLLLVVGSIVYFVERKSNEDNFGGERSVLRGIGSGFWWAGVTMTTIGYGDKAPVTFWGRGIALLWMLVAMAVTSVLTASLVSAVIGSGSEKIKVPSDLRNMKVGAVQNSEAVQYLGEERIVFEEYKDLKSALGAIPKDDIEVVIHGVPEMRYVINNDSDLAAQVRSINIEPHYYAMAIPSGSELRKPLNKALINVLKSPSWKKELDRFVPEKKK